MNTIYIAGPITGKKDYKETFGAAESYLGWKGWTVLNPAMLPEGMPEHNYMPICFAMLNACDAVVLLDGSALSNGAMLEARFAEYQGKTIYNGLESVPTIIGG